MDQLVNAAMMSSVESKRWFRSEMSRSEAESALTGKESGSFLVRPSSRPQCLSLSHVQDDGSVGHALISISANNDGNDNASLLWRLEENDERFQSCEHLLRSLKTLKFKSKKSSEKSSSSSTSSKKSSKKKKASQDSEAIALKKKGEPSSSPSSSTKKKTKKKKAAAADVSVDSNGTTTEGGKGKKKNRTGSSIAEDSELSQLVKVEPLKQRSSKSKGAEGSHHSGSKSADKIISSSSSDSKKRSKKSKDSSNPAPPASSSSVVPGFVPFAEKVNRVPVQSNEKANLSSPVSPAEQVQRPLHPPPLSAPPPIPPASSSTSPAPQVVHGTTALLSSATSREEKPHDNQLPSVSPGQEFSPSSSEEPPPPVPRPSTKPGQPAIFSRPQSSSKSPISVSKQSSPVMDKGSAGAQHVVRVADRRPTPLTLDEIHLILKFLPRFKPMKKSLQSVPAAALAPLDEPRPSWLGTTITEQQPLQIFHGLAPWHSASGGYTRLSAPAQATAREVCRAICRRHGFARCHTLFQLAIFSEHPVGAASTPAAPRFLGDSDRPVALASMWARRGNVANRVFVLGFRPDFAPKAQEISRRPPCQHCNMDHQICRLKLAGDALPKSKKSGKNKTKGPPQSPVVELLLCRVCADDFRADAALSSDSAGRCHQCKHGKAQHKIRRRGERSLLELLCDTCAVAARADADRLAASRASRPSKCVQCGGRRPKARVTFNEKVLWLCGPCTSNLRDRVRQSHASSAPAKPPRPSTTETTAAVDSEPLPTSSVMKSIVDYSSDKDELGEEDGYHSDSSDASSRSVAEEFAVPEDDMGSFQAFLQSRSQQLQEQSSHAPLPPPIAALTHDEDGLLVDAENGVEEDRGELAATAPGDSDSPRDNDEAETVAMMSASAEVASEDDLKPMTPAELASRGGPTFARVSARQFSDSEVVKQLQEKRRLEEIAKKWKQEQELSGDSAAGSKRVPPPKPPRPGSGIIPRSTPSASPPASPSIYGVGPDGRPIKPPRPGSRTNSRPGSALLKSKENEEVSMSSLSSNAAQPLKSDSEHLVVKCKARARGNFSNPQDGEVGFEKGDIVEVIDNDQSDWWRVRLNSKVGFAPANGLEVIGKDSVVTEVKSDMMKVKEKKARELVKTNTAVGREQEGGAVKSSQQSSPSPLCSHCQQALASPYKFCLSCGRKQEQHQKAAPVVSKASDDGPKCSKCSLKLEAPFAFCLHCGARQEQKRISPEISDPSDDSKIDDGKSLQQEPAASATGNFFPRTLSAELNPSHSPSAEALHRLDELLDAAPTEPSSDVSTLRLPSRDAPKPPIAGLEVTEEVSTEPAPSGVSDFSLADLRLLDQLVAPSIEAKSDDVALASIEMNPPNKVAPKPSKKKKKAPLPPPSAKKSNNVVDDEAALRRELAAQNRSLRETLASSASSLSSSSSSSSNASRCPVCKAVIVEIERARHCHHCGHDLKAAASSPSDLFVQAFDQASKSGTGTIDLLSFEPIESKMDMSFDQADEEDEFAQILKGVEDLAADLDKEILF